MNKISEGAEANVYAVKIFETSAIAKIREPKKYRIKMLDDSIRRARTKNEARIMARLRLLGMAVPSLIACTEHAIYMEALSGVLLRDSRNPKTNVFNQLGIILAKMHSADVAHGDFTPANIMLIKDKVFLIDFGLSEVTNSFEEKALDILLIKRSISKKQFGRLLQSYSKNYKNSKIILSRLSKIEKRGRYQTRTLE